MHINHWKQKSKQISKRPLKENNVKTKKNWTSSQKYLWIPLVLANYSWTGDLTQYVVYTTVRFHWRKVISFCRCLWDADSFVVRVGSSCILASLSAGTTSVKVFYVLPQCLWACMSMNPAVSGRQCLLEVIHNLWQL